MKIIKVTQGTHEWAALRAHHNTASEAPAMMGVSKYQTRDELLRQKATGLVPEVNKHQQAIFDRGHAAEAAARDLLEVDTGEEFYPITAVSDDNTLLVSLDGITLDDITLFEHKLWNEKLAARVRNEDLEPHYYWQLEQQILVSGAERVIFVCSDGTRENWVQMEYLPVAGRAAQLVAGWAQFDIDKAAYAPSVIVERPKAAVTLALPALFIQAKGEITTSNMQEYGDALAARLKFVRAIALVTDQNFADAKDAAKLLRENIESAKLVKAAMLAQTTTVGEAARMIDAWCEDMRVTALQLEKDVLREDSAKKIAMILATKEAFEKHVAALEVETVPHRLVYAAPVFSNAIKNKRNFASMQDGLDTMLAQSKIETNALADKMRANLTILRTLGSDYKFLFHDAGQILAKAPDDLTLLVKARIDTHKAEVAKKEEATRQRVQAEEQAKAEADARAKVALEVAAALEFERGMADAKLLVDIAAQQNAPQIIQAAPAVEYIAAPAIEIVAPAATVVNITRPVSASTAPPSLKLGQIGERLGFLVTGAFLSTLGFEPAAQVKNALLFHEADFGLICAALVKHIEAVQMQQAA